MVAENVLLLKIHKLGSKVHSSVSVKIQWYVQCSMNASEFIHLGLVVQQCYITSVEEMNCFENSCCITKHTELLILRMQLSAINVELSRLERVSCSNALVWA